jgi:hypothetical protein
MTEKDFRKRILNLMRQPNIDEIKYNLQYLNKKTTAKPVKIKHFWPKTKSQWNMRNLESTKMKKAYTEINALHWLIHHK